MSEVDNNILSHRHVSIHPDGRLKTMVKEADKYTSVEKEIHGKQIKVWRGLLIGTVFKVDERFYWADLDTEKFIEGVIEAENELSVAERFEKTIVDTHLKSRNS